MEGGLYCENFVQIGVTADAGDHFKNRATIPLAPCILYTVPTPVMSNRYSQKSLRLLNPTLELKGTGSRDRIKYMDKN